MIFAADVQYADDTALAAGILFSGWESCRIEKTVLKAIENIAPYEPGSFYKRELPCILALLAEIGELPEAIVVDGYVSLGKTGRPGLGMHLYNSLDGTVPVIGVAKKEFADTPDECRLLRGESTRPLYVTSVGMELETAKSCVAAMHGNHRIPALLKRVDQLCRGIDA